MRKFIKIVTILTLLLVIASAVLPIIPAAAEGGEETSPWGEVFDEYGHLLPSVVDLGEVEVEASWMDIGIPGVLEINPTFHEYVTASGNTLLVPSASTLFFMGLAPVESGLVETYASLQNGQGMAITGASLLVHLMNQTLSGRQLLAAIGEFGYTEPNLFADELISGKENIWSFAGADILNIIMELMIVGFEDDMLATTYLLYLKGDCEESPLGCLENLCQIAPQACLESPPGQIPAGSAPVCPPSTITAGIPQLSILPVAPEYPLVSLQDPERRGVDLAVSVIIPPTLEVIYIAVPRYENITHCVPPEGPSTGIKNCKTDPSLKGNNGTWITTRDVVEITCERQVNVYPERITALSARATLTPAARSWIEQDLAAYYPGTTVLQGTLSLIPGLAGITPWCDTAGVCHAEGTLPKVQFLDPGTHALELVVQTAGTPVTAARLLRQTGEVTIGLVSVRLIAVDSQ